MAQARTRHDWRQTAAILADIRNAGFGAKKMWSPDECDPTAAKRRRKPDFVRATPEQIWKGQAP